MSEGRFARGLRMLGQSWRFLRERPRLIALPLLSTILGTAVGIGIGAVVYLAVHNSVDHQAAFVIAICAGMWPSSVIGTFLGVGFLAMVMDDLEGREPRIGDGLAFAMQRWRSILGWTLLA